MNECPIIQLDHLDPRKARSLGQILQTILALEGTEETFGQIIDGLPTFANAVPIAMDPWRQGIEERNHPTEASIELFRAFRGKLQPHLLMVDAKVGNSYHNTSQALLSNKSQRLHEITKRRIWVLTSLLYTFWSSLP